LRLVRSRNCRCDDDTLSAKRSRPVDWETRKVHARKERVFWLGPDQRITSGPAATAAAFKGRIHGCTPNASLKRTIPLAPRAPSIHGTFEHADRLCSCPFIGGRSEVTGGRTMRWHFRTSFVWANASLRQNRPFHNRSFGESQNNQPITDDRRVPD